ncbi:MAG: alpha-mannosidase [Actinomycetota bacterium]
MHDRSGFIRARAKRLLDDHLTPSVYAGRVPLGVEIQELGGEPISPGEAAAGQFRPFRTGEVWGGAWDTAWFRLRGRIPTEWRGREVVALIDIGYDGLPGFGAEALIWEGDRPVRGISPHHREHTVAAPARGGESVEIMVEAAANPAAPWGAATWPLLMPDPGGTPLFRLSAADLAVARRDRYRFWLDFRLLLDLAEHLPREEPRAAQILRSLNDACNLLDPTDLDATMDRAHVPLAAALSPPAVPSALRVSAIGHAHIDTAWLWPYREARRKCARTFASALRLMDEYPDYHFSASAAQHYAWMKEHYPPLFEEIRTRVAEGRFEPVGSMWVESDCNLVSGESLVRQLVYGKRFFLGELGVETVDVWLPDVFGYPAVLPQLMAQAGVRYVLMHKLSWNQYNAFPHHTFAWEGLDGTRILTHVPPAGSYNSEFKMNDLLGGVRHFREQGSATRFAYLYGYGDGGGGPSREMVETAARLRDLEGAPRVELGGAAPFFQMAEQDAADAPVWVGELYLEEHRGTYTSQARTKKANRLCERLLHEAELWSALRLDAPAAYPAEALDRAWKALLLNQFHDVLPGSSIHWVYEENLRDLAQVGEAAERAAAEAVSAIADDVDLSGAGPMVVVFNAGSHDRRDLVEVTHQPDLEVRSAAGPDGGLVPVQGNGDGLLFAADVPGFGWAAYELRSDPFPPAGSIPTGVEIDVAGRRLENDQLRVTWDEHALLDSVWDKVAGREVLAPGSRGNVFQLHDDYPNYWDAWDVDLHYRERVEDLLGLEAIEAAEVGPVRAGVRFSRSFGASSIRQTMRLAASSRRLEFDTEASWHESHKFLKVAFPVDVRALEASYDMQFGHVTRPTHANTRWDLARFEVCAHKWADLSESGYGVALLNDCKYGYDVVGNVLRLSLLRASTWPDPEADRGDQRFVYALYPHAGGLREGGVIEEGYAQNLPLRAVARFGERTTAPPREDGFGRPPRGSFLSVDRQGVVIETVKRSDRGSEVVVRCYEAWGGRGRVRLRCALPIEAAERTDLLERHDVPAEVGPGGVGFEVRPFEVVTLKLTLAGDFSSRART